MSTHLNIFPSPIHLPVYVKIDDEEVVIGTIHIDVSADGASNAHLVVTDEAVPSPIDF